ncbi:MAG: glycosyl hydrolase 115 family protein, partial [Bacteroidales bacterium]|nr:glycosyl hydrolase 115 family protein [Bacteroidales bacterium]
MKNYFLSLLFFFCGLVSVSAKDIILSKGNVSIVVQKSVDEPVRLAVESLVKDFDKVMGFTPSSHDAIEKGRINIIIEENKKTGGNEAHELKVDTKNDVIYLRGSDMRGVIYAIYSFSEHILGVPALWYYSGWMPERKDQIIVKTTDSRKWNEPDVKYRSWFPNDTDLLVPWRMLSKENDELWLETMLRLKMNTVELEATVTYDNQELSREAKLLKKYGLILTSHHHVAMNNNFQNWEGYWRKVRNMEPPKLLLSDMKSIKEFWQYSINTVLKNKQENIWQISFRGISDQPFWAAFSDAPETDSLRAEVINRMLSIQLDMVKKSTGNEHPVVRMTFYDELSDMLAKGYLKPPTGENILWTFVAARRDHYPNDDLVNMDFTKTKVNLGYYMNLQFTSTGSHLAAAESPWKMEYNYRYVASKAPLLFSVVNAGNIREHIIELAANASMMWDMSSYSSDRFVREFCSQYFGDKYAESASALLASYYNAYWQPKSPDFKDMKRQYLFHDLRCGKVIDQIGNRFFDYNDNPLVDIGFERVKGRSFRIQGNNQVDTLIVQLALAEERFADVEKDIESFMNQHGDMNNKILFRHNYWAHCRYMHMLSRAARLFVEAYRLQNAGASKMYDAIDALTQARKTLLATEEGNFDKWYAGDRIFGFDGKLRVMRDILHEMTKNAGANAWMTGDDAVPACDNSKLRILNHWDNLDGSIERGYAGQSIWLWDELPNKVSERVYEYARLNADLGINGIVLNNVNADPRVLRHDYLLKVKALADVFRQYGIKVYVSANFASCLKPSDTPDTFRAWGGVGCLDTADPLNKDVAKWWKDKVKEIYSLIPDFGGFLIKADSEGMPGPQTYGRSHVDGANMLAKALKPYGGIVMWRTFVYNPDVDKDRIKRCYKEFVALDGKFAKNVILQVKNGGLDFQPSEPVQPLFFAMPKTKLMPEFQITQEYTGQSTYLVNLLPMWRNFMRDLGKEQWNRMVGIAGVANVGDDTNWTGHLFAQFNWFAFGRLAQNPDITDDELYHEWISKTFGVDQASEQIIRQMMEPTWWDYTLSHSPFGIGFTLKREDHISAGFDQRVGKEWRFDEYGIGSDRTQSGSDYVSQFPEHMRKLYSDPNTCPDEYLLCFHYLPWSFKMKDGRTLREAFEEGLKAGVNRAMKNKELWQGLKGKVADDVYISVLA